ncbi:hypothetical protein QA612_09730 [Evansella sp. AB-P1]|nr:hypothetical protein [Evansella sp. AB-P1]MDG5787779.1 hypothetical protein [Evansella sp. AB-P1]
MVVDAFIYFYFIGAGLAAGIGTITFIGWKVVQRSQQKKNKGSKRKVIA